MLYDGKYASKTRAKSNKWSLCGVALYLIISHELFKVKKKGAPKHALKSIKNQISPELLTAATSALTEATMISVWIPAPQLTEPSGLEMPMYAAALDFEDCSTAFSV